MNSEKERRHSDFAAIKRKVFLRVLLAAICAVALVIVLRWVSYGKLGDWIVETLSSAFRIDSEAAYRIYHYGFQNSMEMLYAIAIIIFLVVGFRLVIRSLGHYLDEITSGIDRLSEGQDAELQLSPELSFVENRLHNVQQKLERREQQNRQSEQRKNDLVIYSAHDIRTPLTSTLGYLVLLDENPNLPFEERKKYIHIALAKTRELDSMLDELFEISRYNLHDITLEKTRIDLYSMLLQMKEECYPQLRAGSKNLMIRVAEDLYVNGDADKLARALQNLLKNAIAYSVPESTIEITSQLSEETVTVCIRNQCSPIPQEKLGRLFDPGFRLDNRRPDNSAGAGLGLAIANEIVLLHGGTICAENVDDGIQFVLTFPKASSID